MTATNPDQEHDGRVSFFSLVDFWPSLLERRRSFVLQIVKALAVADLTVCAAVARYCARRAAREETREGDRAVRQIRNRIRANEARQAIRRSLRMKGGA